MGIKIVPCVCLIRILALSRNEWAIKLELLPGSIEIPPMFPGPRPSATVSAAPAPTAATAPPSLIAVTTTCAPRPSTLVGTPNLVQALVENMRRQILHCFNGAL